MQDPCEWPTGSSTNACSLASSASAIFTSYFTVADLNRESSWGQQVSLTSGTGKALLSFLHSELESTIVKEEDSSFWLLSDNMKLASSPDH